MIAPIIQAATQTHTQKLPIAVASGVMPSGQPMRKK